MGSLYFVFLTNLVFFSDLSLTTVFFALECKAKGLDEDSIGLIVTSQVLGRFLSNALAEKLSVFDQRKLMIAVQAGYSICIYCFAFIDFFDSSLVFGLLSTLNNIGVGFFHAKYAILATSAAANSTKDEKEYQKQMMFYGNTRVFGLCFGSYLGSLIYTYFEYKLTFVFIASITVLTMVLFIFFAEVPKLKHEINKSEENSTTIYKTCVKNRVFATKYTLDVLVRISYFYFWVDYSINMSTRFGLSASVISLLFGIPALITIIIMTFYGFVKWKGSASLHLQFGAFLSILGLLLLPPCDVIGLPQEVWLAVLGNLFLEMTIGIFSVKMTQSIYDTIILIFPMAPKSQLNRICANFFVLSWTFSYMFGPSFIGYTTYYLSMDYSVLILAALIVIVYCINLIFGEGYLEIVKYYKAISKKGGSEEGVETYENFNDEEEKK